ncbi:T9SS type A sorting domain-containing protein [uncultured Algibacter sp.]|uniref:T9SS type A sorting domain-containing protein n=1 Tax=uncultured Algibacter sp. TaxID=298659 RepID=UPI0026154D32|nr:T9SS type A sorting domain-containing protein [uncultured Algibacter sp.]
MKTTLFFLLALLNFALTLNAQIRSIMVDPATNDITVKVKNFGSSTVDITNYWLCDFPQYDRFSDTSIVGSGDFLLSPDEEVTVIWVSGLDNTNGELGIYNTNSFSSSSAMEDYMQWVTSGHQREPVAVAKGIWTAGTTVNVTPPYQYNGDGSQNGSTFWESTLSTKELTLSEFRISPNPGATLIQFKFPKNIKQSRATIYDILGKAVYTSENIINSKVDISNWKSGLYLIKVSAFGKTVSKRFIKQ